MAAAGTRCLVPGCGNPYLAWHDVGAGNAVAMCLPHVEQAVASAVPADRLLALQRSSDGEVRRAWRQRRVLLRVAGNFYYETPVVFRLGSVTCVGFSRSEHDDLLLDLRMPTTSGERRARMTGGFWEVLPTGAALVSPRSGRLLDIAYPNGDRFRAELTDVQSALALQRRFGNVARWAYRVRFPVTLAEITVTVANTDLVFTPDDTCLGGPTTLDCFTAHARSAIDIPMGYEQLVGLFP